MSKAVMIILSFLLGTIGPLVHAAPCDSVEREMVRGQVALEYAKDASGYLESAQQFERAIATAPDCANAHFNLGLVYEKAEEYEKAATALEYYLKLEPDAVDVSEVRKKLYALEYRAEKKKQENESRIAQQLLAQAQKWNKLEGRWCIVNKCGSNRPSYDITVAGDSISIIMRTRHENLGGCKMSFRAEWTGTLNDDGAISGNHRYGDYRYEQRCAAGRLPINQWNWQTRSFTGSVAGGGELVSVQWKEQYDGFSGMIKRSFQRH